MKKSLIVTLYANTNYGNKLQNYAVYKLLCDRHVAVKNLKNHRHLNYKRNIIFSYIKFLLSKIKYLKIGYSEFGFFNYYKRLKKFKEFDNLMPKTKHYFNYLKLKKYEKYDYLFVGSDQVWNPDMALDDLMLFKYFKNKNKISISASIALNVISESTKKRFKENLKDFKAISLREESGKNLIEECTNRKDVELLVDPTMLINRGVWDTLSKNVKFSQEIPKRYILLYFFGEKPNIYISQIESFAKTNNLKIIDIYDKNGDWNTCGPREFLYLEKNASLICTNSFHSAVFGIIFNTPILVFERSASKLNMNSRIDTLLSKFELKDSKYTGSINKCILETDFSKVNLILENERKKGVEFIEKALDIESKE